MADKTNDPVPPVPPKFDPARPLTEAEKIARLDRFIGNVSDLVWAPCVSCVRKSRGGFCEAFPDGIPEEFLDGRLRHTEPYPGDRGLLYLPITPAPPTAPKDKRRPARPQPGGAEDSPETFVPRGFGERYLLEVLAVSPEEILELRNTPRVPTVPPEELQEWRAKQARERQRRRSG